MPSKHTPDRFLNFKEVAEMIGVDIETLRKGKCQTDEIPRIRLSYRKVVFSLLEVQAWMSRKAEEAREEKSKQKATVRRLLADKDQIRQAINKTYLTIINGGKYR